MSAPPYRPYVVPQVILNITLIPEPSNVIVVFFYSSSWYHLILKALSLLTSNIAELSGV